MYTIGKIIFDNYLELSVETADIIAGIIAEKPDALLCFPAGETSIGTFNHLIDLYKGGKISFSRCKIVGLDEWMNLGDRRNENCFSFLKKHLFDHIDYSEGNLCFFDGESANPEEECLKTDDFIRENGPIDMILLGVGMNGHLGLNEPGSSFDLYSHIVQLDEVTREVGQKYFQGEVHLSEGITLGLKSIMEAKSVLVQMNGIRKAEIYRRLKSCEITMDFPVSILKSHHNSLLLLDKDAAGRNNRVKGLCRR